MYSIGTIISNCLFIKLGNVLYYVMTIIELFIFRIENYNE